MNSILIKNVTLISVSKDRDQIEKNIDIKIIDDKISEIGNNLVCQDATIIDGSNKVVTPGFINTHSHLPMILFKNSIDGLKLEEWLEGFIWPIENKLTNQEIYYASLLSCLEMLENGITTVHDLYFHYEQIIRAAEEVGIDLIVSRGLMDNDENGLNRIKETLELIKKYKNIKFTMGIHGLYTCSEEYLKKITNLAREKNMIVHMHFCETESEVKTIKTRFNVKHPSEVFKKYFSNLKCILVHGVKLRNYDLKQLSKMNVSISHCPISNLMLGCGIANIAKMQELGINIALGTDGQGSGNNCSILDNMRTASILQKGYNENPLLLPTYEVLKMATINGAKALGLEDEIGSIDIGKKANLIFFEFNQVKDFPTNNYISNIVYNANSSNICMVLVNGKIVMKNKTFNVNKYDIIEKCNKIITKIFNN